MKKSIAELAHRTLLVAGSLFRAIKVVQDHLRATLDLGAATFLTGGMAVGGLGLVGVLRSPLDEPQAHRSTGVTEGSITVSDANPQGPSRAPEVRLRLYRDGAAVIVEVALPPSEGGGR